MQEDATVQELFNLLRNATSEQIAQIEKAYKQPKPKSTITTLTVTHRYACKLCGNIWSEDHEVQIKSKSKYTSGKVDQTVSFCDRCEEHFSNYLVPNEAIAFLLAYIRRLCHQQKGNALTDFSWLDLNDRQLELFKLMEGL